MLEKLIDFMARFPFGARRIDANAIFWGVVLFAVVVLPLVVIAFVEDRR